MRGVNLIVAQLFHLEETKLKNSKKVFLHSEILVFIALESEINPSDWTFDVPVVYTGIGKVNAAVSAEREVLRFSPKLVINLGTAGAFNEKYRGLCEIDSVIQRDFDTSPLAPRGVVPFQDSPSTFFSEFGNLKCGTGDNFMTEPDDWSVKNGIHLVDMELYSIAKVCAEYNIPWRSIKFVTDIIGKNSGDEWKDGLGNAQRELLDWFSANIY